MATIPLTQVYKLTVQLRTLDKLHSIGLHYKVGGSYDPVISAQQLAEAWHTQIGLTLRNCLAIETTTEGYYVSHTLPSAAAPYSMAINSLPGTRPGNSIPRNSCAVFTLSSSQPEAERSGRIYLGGLAKDDMLAGRWDGNFVNAQLDTLRTALKTQVTGSGGPFDPVIVRRAGSGTPGLPFALAIASVRLTDIVYSQRRRTTKQFGTFN